MFKGLWSVVNQDDHKRFPDPGEIMKHKSGAIMLRCPECNSLQFTAAIITGPDDAPTISKPIVCGAGSCKRCAVRFSIDAGRTIKESSEDNGGKIGIPEKLKQAGVKKAPRIKIDR